MVTKAHERDLWIESKVGHKLVQLVKLSGYVTSSSEMLVLLRSIGYGSDELRQKQAKKDTVVVGELLIHGHKTVVWTVTHKKIGRIKYILIN